MKELLKKIIIEISLKWIKFRGYLSVFSCIFSTVWPKFLPLDSGIQPGCLCSLPALVQLPICAGSERLCLLLLSQYFCSQTSKKAKICLTNCICGNIIWHVRVSSREQRSRARSRRGGSRKTGSRARPRRDFFPDSDSDRDSDETFQISRNLGLVHVEFFCLLDSQPWFQSQ